LTTPQASVGIPTFNRSGRLKHCVASILAQSAQDFEIVISDNGSSDDTWTVCQDFARGDTRFRVFRQEPPVNSTQNFDFVRRQARGAYVLLLGDDDWIDADYLERCIGVLIAKPDRIAVGGRPTYYRDGKALFQGVPLQADHEDPSARLLQALSLLVDAGTFHAVFRRSMSGPIPILNVFGMDYLYICEAAYCGKIETLASTAVHRIDNSHLKPIADSVQGLGLPPEQGRDHYGSILALLFWYVAAVGRRFCEMAFWPRLTLAARTAAIVFRRWQVRDEDGLAVVAQSIFADAALPDAMRSIRGRLVEESLAEIKDPQSRLWNDLLPEILPTLTRLGFSKVPPTPGERDLLLRLHGSLNDITDTARRDCALTTVRLFY
jgi:glycosyltransferase involved in cell wall biosynthesis